MTRQSLLVAVVLLSTACPRPPEEPVAPVGQPDDAAKPEPPPAIVDRVEKLEIGWGIATLTEGGVLEFLGPPEVDAWLAERGPIEDIWQASNVCVRTAAGTSCKLWQRDIQIEPPTDAEVIDVEWSSTMLCAATADGALWCNFGRDPHSKPLRRYPISGVQDVEAQDNFGCARLEGGKVQCWLGEKTLADFCRQAQDAPGCQALAPEQAKWPAPSREFVGIRDIAAGYKYVCTLHEDGVPRCLDEFERDVGSLGKNTGPLAGAPALVEIHGGLRHVCGRSEAGEVWCWGSNEYGQLGDGTTTSAKPPVPTRVDGIPAVEQLALANAHACALAQGEIWCWGWLTNTPTDPVPTEIPGVVASELAVEEQRSCARVAAGWKCWGGETHTPGGVAAVSTVVDATRDEKFGDGCRFGSGRLRCDDGEEVWLDLKGVIDVTRTSDPVCALLHERVECHESFADEKTVIRVPASVSLHGSLSYGCVLSKTGAVHCWGAETSAAPIDLPGKQLAVSASSVLDQACALDESGTARCWTAEQPPIAVGMADVVEVHGSPAFGCVRDRAGKIACWGRYLVEDIYGPATKLAEPVTIQLPAPAVELGVGEEDHACARIDDGRVFCWGSEAYGQRGRLAAEFATRPRKIEVD